MVERIPETELYCLNQIKSINDKFEPYGCWQTKLLDTCFDAVVDSILSSGCKLLLYVSDKNRPKTKEDYVQFTKLKKFQKHEKYPDEYVHQFIDHILSQNLTDEQFENIESKLKTQKFNSYNAFEVILINGSVTFFAIELFFILTII